MTDTNLTIQLLTYSKSYGFEQYFFSEMATLQATTLLPNDKKIVASKIFAYTKGNEYLNEETAVNFRTVRDFNDFFLNNRAYYIHDCEIEMENGLIIKSHDDGEVHIQFPEGSPDHAFIALIFNTYNLDAALIDWLKSKPGHYISIDSQSRVMGEFMSFDDYLENGPS